MLYFTPVRCGAVQGFSNGPTSRPYVHQWEKRENYSIFIFSQNQDSSRHINVMSREPDKLRIFVNYALKTPEYECLSNFSCITYCSNFSAYARGFVLFRIYESRSGPGREKPVRRFPRTRKFSCWTSVKSTKVSVLTSCEVATR